jgi:hypothetical protein
MLNKEVQNALYLMSELPEYGLIWIVLSFLMGLCGKNT